MGFDTFDFGANDIDVGSEKWRRTEEADPIAVAHLSRWSTADGHFCHFVVTAVAVLIALLQLLLSNTNNNKKKKQHSIKSLSQETIFDLNSFLHTTNTTVISRFQFY